MAFLPRSSTLAPTPGVLSYSRLVKTTVSSQDKNRGRRGSMKGCSRLRQLQPSKKSAVHIHAQIRERCGIMIFLSVFSVHGLLTLALHAAGLGGAASTHGCRLPAAGILEDSWGINMLHIPPALLGRFFSKTITWICSRALAEQIQPGKHCRGRI